MHFLAEKRFIIVNVTMLLGVSIIKTKQNVNVNYYYCCQQCSNYSNAVMKMGWGGAGELTE